MKKILNYLLIFTMLIYSTNAMAWWNCSWMNRVAIGISNTGTTQTNYVVEIRFTNSTVSNYTWSNLDKDLRFVDADDSTVLKHFSMPRSSTTQEVLVWVLIPSVPVGTKTIYMYYNNNAATSVSNPSGVLVSGIRMYTKGGTAATSFSNYNAWWNAFNLSANGQSGYGCKILTDMTSINNSGQFGSAANIIFSYVTVLTANSTGTWQTRHGPDYGWGGGLYVNDNIMQEKYGTDLWWNNAWTATQILNGNFTATNGSYYVIRSYGGEGGADGITQLQIANPTGTWRVMSTANYTLNAPPCESPNVTKVVNSPQVTVPLLSKIVTPFSDPVNGTINPKMFPGSRVRYTITMTSDGGSGIDSGSVVITDLIPINTKMYVGDLGAVGSGPVLFTNGSVSSGLTYTKTNLTYSNNNGTTWTYTPIADSQTSDSNITNIKVNPVGAFSCSNGTAKPSFNLSFDVIIK